MDFLNYESIEEFGYLFSEEGKLQNKETGNPFEFCVRADDHSYNQKHYEALGEKITPFVYNLLETECGLEKLSVPIAAIEETDPQTFIFASRNFKEQDKLLVLIHGSGVVRAGQWSRKLIINDSLQSGTQVPFIQRAQNEGYAVLITNTNDNSSVNSDGHKVPIKGSENPVDHGIFAWENYVQKTKATKIAIVAHSYGGVVVMNMYKRLKNDFDNRVFALALTDSVHSTVPDGNLLQIARHWVTSSQPVNVLLDKQYRNEIERFSAGCKEHERTSWSSFQSIFTFFAERLNKSSSEDLSPKKKQKTDDQAAEQPTS